MDIVTAVVRYLETKPAVVTAATGGLNKWKLEEDIAHTGNVGVAIRTGGSWARSRFHSARYPRVHFRVHGDPSRSVSGAATAEDAETKAMALWQLIDSFMHRTTRFDEMWGDVRVLGSNRESDPTVIERPGERTVLLQAVYDLKVG